MARSALLLDKLGCSICYEKLTLPKTLPCLHSFCGYCLTQYILSKTEHRMLLGFHCPTCREFIHVVDPTQPIGAWGKQFRTNFHLRDLVETESLAIAGQVFCQQHAGKALDLYCTKCVCALCSVCAIKRHLKCGEIESIDNVVCSKRSKLKLLTSRLQKAVNVSESEKEEAELYARDLRKNKRDVTAEVKDWERKVMYAIMKQTKALLAEVDETVTEELADVSKWLYSVDTKIKSTRALIEDINQVLENKTTPSVDLPSASVELEVRSLQLLEKSEIVAPCRSTLTFSKTEWSKGSCTIGHVILTKTPADAQVSAGEGKERSYSVLGEPVSLLKEINCQTEHDKKEPCLLDLIVLGDEHTLVVTDSTNKCIKSYSFVEDGAITCRLPMLNPRCLAAIGDDTFVLTTESRNIYFFKVSRVMSMESRTQIGLWFEMKACYGIASLPENRLAISFTNHPGIEIITYRGTVLQSISLPKEHLSCCLSAGEGLLVASCSNTGRLFVLDEDGDVIFEEGRIPFTCSPQGVVCDGKIVLYADSNNVSVNEVVGSLVTPMLTARNGLKCPRGLCLSGTESLYVTDGGVVKLFRYKNLSSFKSDVEKTNLTSPADVSDLIDV